MIGLNDAGLMMVSQEYLKPIPSPANAIIHKRFTEHFLCAKTVQDIEGTKRGVRNYPCPWGAHSIDKGERKGGGEGKRREDGEERGGGRRGGEEKKGEEIETKKPQWIPIILFFVLFCT